ncbi:MAG: luciferase family protein [Armatimonadota bacterium]
MELLRILAKHLGALKRVPLLPHLFDALLTLIYALCAPRRFRAVARVIDSVSNWPGVRLTCHRFGGTQFDLHGRELGHIHGNGVLDVYLDRETRDAVVGSGEALPHHTFPRSGWVSMLVATEADARRGLQLLWLGMESRRACRMGASKSGQSAGCPDRVES